MQVSLTEYMKEMENSNRKEEILHFQSVLAEFKITFSELKNLLSIVIRVST